MGLLRKKVFCIVNRQVNKETATKGEKTFASYISDTESVFRIYKQFKKTTQIKGALWN